MRRPVFKRQHVLIGLAILLIAGDAGYLVYQHADHTTQQSTLGSQNVPSSKKPAQAAVDNYTVPPTNPKYLNIPSLKVHSRIYKLGVSKSNQVLAPSNIHDVGWYQQSALPGAPGATFLDGHVSSWTDKGVFYNIKKLKAGDTIEIVRGDNSRATYHVVKLQTYDADNVDMQQALSPIQTDKSGLNLMTCAGSVKKGSSEFTERLVVYASIVSPLAR